VDASKSPRASVDSQEPREASRTQEDDSVGLLRLTALVTGAPPGARQVHRKS
jgi:hypothetical protein